MLFLTSASLKEFQISLSISEDLVFEGGSAIIPASKTSSPLSSGNIQGSNIYRDSTTTLPRS